MPKTALDSLLDLLGDQDERVQSAFLAFVAAGESAQTIDDLVHKVAEHEIDAALEVLHSLIERFANVVPAVFNTVGEAAANELDIAIPDIPITISFDPTNIRAAQLVSAERARVIRQLSEQQQASTMQAISRALANGAGTQEMGRAIRQSIGLTPNQEAYVANYRQQLQNLDTRALDRALRDARFDQQFNAAVARDRPLTETQIETMVGRYRAQIIAMRAETIARTEALTAYSLAREEALQQMMDKTRLNANRVLRVWHATHDDRVRDWHLSMEGQKQPPGEPFTDGLGNSVMFPGDPFAPPETRINCRCTLGFEVLPPT